MMWDLSKSLKNTVPVDKLNTLMGANTVLNIMMVKLEIVLRL